MIDLVAVLNYTIYYYYITIVNATALIQSQFVIIKIWYRQSQWQKLARDIM